MNYTSGLPSTTHGNDCVFGIVDQFSKMAILAICKKNITIEYIVNLFFKRVWVHFGLHRPLFDIGTRGSCVLFGLAYGQ